MSFSINARCFFCETIVIIPQTDENLTHYEESKGDNGALFAETFSKACPKCKTMFHVKFKQHQPKQLANQNKKRGLK